MYWNKRFLLIIALLFVVFGNVLAQSPYRIRLADSTYAAQLRGVTGTRTAGITITGTYKSNFRAHQFNVTTTGRYDLYIDATGTGSSYSKDAVWSGTVGKTVTGKTDLERTVSLGVYADPDSNAQIDTQGYENGSVTLVKLADEVLAYVATGGSFTSDSLRDMVGDSVNALSADGVTVLNDGTLKQKVIANTTVLQTLSADSVGMTVQLANGQQWTYYDSTYTEGIIALNSGTVGKQWIRPEVLEGSSVIKSDWLGLTRETDETATIQDALDLCEFYDNLNVVELPPDSFYYSIAESDHSYGCIVIPRNTTLRGVKGRTWLIRLPSETTPTVDDGVAIVNKDYNTATGYNAHGNITIEGISFQESQDPTVYVANGDFIGFAHADGITIRDCSAYNVGTHFADIAGCRNVLIENNYIYNEVRASSASAIQIDWTNTGTILGISGASADLTPCQNVKILANTIEKCFGSYGIHLHNTAGDAMRNIVISNNVVNVDSASFGIGKDGTTNIIDFTVSDNVIKTSEYGGGIRWNAVSTDTTWYGKITGNTISGEGRLGIFLGTASGFNLSGGWLMVKGVSITDNAINLKFSSETFTQEAGIWVYGVEDADISNNTVNVYQYKGSSTWFTSNILLYASKQLSVRNNFINQADSNLTASWSGYGILYDYDGVTNYGRATNIDISNNTFAGKFRHAIRFDTAQVTPTLVKGIISGNKAINMTYTKSALQEPGWLSDLTNFPAWVDFGGSGITDSTSFLAVSDSTVYSNITMPVVKGDHDWQYDGRFAFHVEFFERSANPVSVGYPNGLNSHYVDADNLVGIFVKDVEQAGTLGDNNLMVNRFDLVTGNAGVFMMPNETTLKPQILTTGKIRIKVSL